MLIPIAPELRLHQILSTSDSLPNAGSWLPHTRHAESPTCRVCGRGGAPTEPGISGECVEKYTRRPSAVTTSRCSLQEVRSSYCQCRRCAAAAQLITFWSAPCSLTLSDQKAGVYSVPAAELLHSYRSFACKSKRKTCTPLRLLWRNHRHVRDGCPLFIARCAPAKDVPTCARQSQPAQTIEMQHGVRNSVSFGCVTAMQMGSNASGQRAIRLTQLRTPWGVHRLGCEVGNLSAACRALAA